MRPIVWLIATLALCAASCGGGGGSPDVVHPRVVRSLLVQHHEIPGRAGWFFGLAWTKDDLVVGYYPNPDSASRAPFSLWLLSLDGQILNQLALPADQECSAANGRTEYRWPQPLSGGRVAAVRSCASIPPSAPDAIVAVTPQTAHVEVLAPASQAFPRTISWNEAADRGVFAQSSDICASIAFVDHGGVRPISVSIGRGAQRWRLDAAFREGAGACDHDGRADLPTWASTTNQIAFAASPKSVGVAGQARLDQPWNVYVMDANTQRPQTVLTEITAPGGLEWSPDGTWLAFSGDVRGAGSGTWLFKPDTRSLTRISMNRMQSLAWSPDGRQLAGITAPASTAFPPVSMIEIFDVAAIVTPT